MITKQLDVFEHMKPEDTFETRVQARRLMAADSAKGCTQPIQLSGQIVVDDAVTGRRIYDWSSQRDELNGTIYVPCKTRRADRCEHCARIYQGDAYRLIVDGLRGGEFVPEEVRKHPALFVTFTAPSFGTVHRHALDKKKNPLPCHPRRGGEICPHGIDFDCKARHDKDDPVVGQAMCPDCYDYDGAVIWNHFAGKLWRQTRIEIEHYLAKKFDTSRLKLRKFFARTEFAKVAEFQARGMVHFHVAIRLDGPDGSNVAKDTKLLTKAIEHAHRRATVATVDGRHIGWGPQLDIGELTTDKRREKVAGYCAKYATKSAEGTGQLSRRIRDDRQIDYLTVNDHLARLVRASWKLGNQALSWIKAQPPKHVHDGDVTIEQDGDVWRLTVVGELVDNSRGVIRRTFKTRADAEAFVITLEAHHHPLEGLTRWAHQFGFGGHFLTKSRSGESQNGPAWLGWSTTFSFLRQRRAEHNAATRQASWEAMSQTGKLVIETRWDFAAVGFANPKDAHIAALRREQDRQQREGVAA